jgi:plasmid replication initiation protein
MPDELSTKNGEVSTPDMLGIIPHYVLQHHAVSRSAHNLSATARKLTAMAMALIPSDLSSLTAAFTFTEFCKAIGYDKGGESFKLFREAINECMGNYISIEIASPKTGKKIWENYTWFTSSRLSEETGIATMTFAPELAAVLLEMKKVYAKINLHDLGELQSKYALRFYEIAKSYESLKGKDGNRDQNWYFERDIDELRKLLGVPDEAYAETKRFRQKVIENPIEEINQAGIGIEITTESVKQGRKLTAIRFNCKQTARTVSKKGGGGKKAAARSEIPEPSPKTADFREEKELERLMERYPKEFAELYEEELAKTTFLPADSLMRLSSAKYTVSKKLREKYGIVK